MKGNELLRILTKAGWYIVREPPGSHKIMAHKDKAFTLTVPVHGSKEVKKGTALAILKQAGLR